MAWFSQLMDRLRAAQGQRPGEQERRVMRIIMRRDELADDGRFLDAVMSELGGQSGPSEPPEPVEERTIEILAAHLRGACGDELDRIGPHVAAPHIRFWSWLDERTGSPVARACLADLLLVAGERDRALDLFLDALERDPTLVQFRVELGRLARERGGEASLRYRMACLRAALAGFRPDGEDEDSDDDYVRELYGELLEEHRADPAALTRIRELGPLIEDAAQRGDLPRAIVRRGPR
jgi:hypothetical protein